MPTIVKELFKQIIDKITKMLSDQAKKQIQRKALILFHSQVDI